MQIQKKGVDKIKISHNKGLLILIIVLIVLLAGVIYFILKNNNSDNIPVEDKECVKDEDCIKVQTGCCSCSMGGEEKCVSSSEKENYDEILSNCLKDRMVCAAMYNCYIKSCSCINNKCSVIADSEIF